MKFDLPARSWAAYSFLLAAACSSSASETDSTHTGSSDVHPLAGGSAAGAGAGGTGLTTHSGGTGAGQAPSASGGQVSGGASSGGQASGGATSGGQASGGAASGGQASGGANSGGQPAGGAAAGGQSAGGSDAGGQAASGSSAPESLTASGCPTDLVGFATVNADGVPTTTGGGNVAPTTVTTLAELRAAAQDSAPRVIVVSGTITTMADGDGFPMEVAGNKTIMGANKAATIVGGLTMKEVSNVIIRNLNIQGSYPNPGPGDTLSSKTSHHIWYDHISVWDADDGLLDITVASDYQTVSWSKFYYTNASNDHRLASLNGSGGGDHPEDWGKLRVTYHHNWWAEKVTSRMPRVVYGQGHQFNNYFNSKGNSYCIGVGSYGSVLIENNYFKDVKNPHQFMYDVYMHAEAEGNVYDNTSGAKDAGPGGSRHAGGQDFKPIPFKPPYPYALDAAEGVPETVQRCAGPQ